MKGSVVREVSSAMGSLMMQKSKTRVVDAVEEGRITFLHRLQDRV